MDGKTTVLIRNWSFSMSKEWDGYSAPETMIMCLAGQVFDHPKFPDRSKVVTSPIESFDGFHVVTRSNTYKLLTVSPDYIVWLAKKGLTYIRKCNGKHEISRI